MKIAIVHLGGLSQLLPATSVIFGIEEYPIAPEITWVVSARDYVQVHKYNKHVKRVLVFSDFIKEVVSYDLLVNLYPCYPTELSANFDYKQATGFGFEPAYDDLKELFIGTASCPDMNVFQLYYKLCGLVWKGQGYCMRYYPKTRSVKSRVGVSVANANLRNYVLDNLDLGDRHVWYIPYKKNLFKKMDEINRCKTVITDDTLTMHIALYLRKYVYFLETVPLTLKPELFNSGEIVTVPNTVFQ
jgi:hypothetical protein